MRANRLVAAAAILVLAGCAPEKKASDSGVNVGANEKAVSSDSSRPPPAAPVVRPAKQAAIPAAFHGVYDGSLEACSKPSDQRLTVSAAQLRFHESIGLVRNVVDGPSGAIWVEADYQGEGESWRSGRDLLLSEGGSKLTISGDGTSLVRIRCPQGEL